MTGAGNECSTAQPEALSFYTIKSESTPFYIHTCQHQCIYTVPILQKRTRQNKPMALEKRQDLKLFCFVYTFPATIIGEPGFHTWKLKSKKASL